MNDASSKYMVINLSYSRKLLLDIKQGCQLLEILASATELTTDYGKPPQIKESVDGVSIEFFSRQQLGELRVTKMIDPGK